MNRGMKLWLLGTSSLVVAGGIGTMFALRQNRVVKPSAEISATSNQPVRSLPVTIVKHLSSYKSRVHSAQALPIKRAVNVRGTWESIKGNNVLFIGPVQGYAIKQLASVWPSLKSIPSVVWTNTTAADARKSWQSEGYSSDPLPAPDTYYSSTSFSKLPVPDAYHRTKGKLTDLSGVLKPSEQQDWVKFFGIVK